MTLAVQTYLRSGGTLEQLSNDLAIRVTRHPNSDDSRIILNYNQLNSPKLNEITMECRSLTLDSKDYSLVSRAFPRFFNVGETIHLMDQFDWTSCWASEKCDGSLVTLSNYNNIWGITTRSTFGDGICNFSGKTWTELFFETISVDRIEKVCQRGNSYVFEFWSPWNKIITNYPQQCSFLLTVYGGEVELEQGYADEVAKGLSCLRPKLYNFSNIEDVQTFIKKIGKDDPTYEGLVLCDKDKNRWKVKNELYVALHHLADNGNIFNPKRLIPLILNGEIEETINYLPDVEKPARELKTELDLAYANLIKLWEEVKNIEGQKEFAQAVLPKTKFTSILFNARKTGKSIEDLWLESSDLILKVLYNK